MGHSPNQHHAAGVKIANQSAILLKSEIISKSNLLAYSYSIMKRLIHKMLI